MADEIFSSSHPLLPPTTEDDRVAWLRLLRSYRVGLSTFYRLMSNYGSAQAALAALPQVAADAGLQNYTAFSESAARSEMAAGKKRAARMVFRGTLDYPLSFDDLTDAPPFLWAVGDLELLQRPIPHHLRLAQWRIKPAELILNILRKMLRSGKISLRPACCFPSN